MVDAGSAGTRAHIFTWVKGDSSVKMRPSSSNHSKCIYKTGISLGSTAGNISRVNDIFDPMVKFLINNIPQEHLPKTKIYVFATAGLRILNESLKAAILERTQERLHLSPLHVKKENIRIMSGTEEAVYGWISVNYLLDSFDDSKGAIDMGGASTQVSYEVNTKIPVTDDGDVHRVKFNGKDHKVFTVSFLGYGANEALKRSLAVSGSKNPCFPAGYKEGDVEGTGDFGICVLNTEKTLEKRKEIFVDKDFYSMASFIYVNQFFNLSAASTIEELEHAGVKFCGTPWKELTEKSSGQHLNYIRNYCFFSAFQRVFLGGGFGFQFKNVFKYPSLDGAELSWALGAMLSEARMVSVDKVDIRQVSLFLLSLIVIFTALYALDYIRNGSTRRSAINKYL